MNDPSGNQSESSEMLPNEPVAENEGSGQVDDRVTSEKTVIKSDTSLVKHDETMDEKSSPRTTSARVTVDAPPTEFGRYRILKELGRGAMGAVYLAEDQQLGRKVALKVPQFEGKVTDAQLARFYREARSAGNLRHSGICPVYDVGSIDGQHYISMAFIEGRPLRDFSKSARKQDGKSVAHIIRKIALAMAEAHEQSVIHRDLKPANVMIDSRNEPVIMDFGLARRVVEDEEKLTHTGTLIGTPAYMSPEQVDGDNSKVGPAADIYSLGVIFYELLTGELPFQGNLLSILKQIATKDPRPPVEIHTEVDPILGTLCLRMLAKKIEDRPDSMKSVARELASWLQNVQARTIRNVESVSADNQIQSASESSPILNTGPQVASAVDSPPLLIDTMSDPVVNRGSERTGSGKKQATLIVVTVGCLAAVVALVAYSFPAANDSSKLKNVARPDSSSSSLASTELPVSVEQVPDKQEPLAKAPPTAVAPFDRAMAQNHQRLWAQYLGVPVEREIVLPERESISFMLIPPGEFMMGSTVDEHAHYLEKAKVDDDLMSLTVLPGEIPQHRVRITQPFYMGKFEVTQEQWWAVTGGDNPSQFKGINLPVEQVTWDEIHEFMEQLGEVTSLGNSALGLPTEAQWEYACRAGTTSAWSFGDREDDVATFGWMQSNSEGTTHAVGQLPPNAFGLFDMHGNLWEWCADWFEPRYSPSDVDDPRGPLSGTDRVFRGGAWGAAPMHCRSAFRAYRPPEKEGNYGMGFRLILRIDVP